VPLAIRRLLMSMGLNVPAGARALLQKPVILDGLLKAITTVVVDCQRTSPDNRE
jgi:hypothetical protein